MARGPVVASGGAPGGLVARQGNARRYTPLGGPDYPPGSETPSVRYYTDWGLYPNQPYVIGPPWSEVVAYDLNVGTDFVFPETQDFSQYKVLIVPALYIADDALLQRISDYVKNGGGFA